LGRLRDALGQFGQLLGPADQDKQRHFRRALLDFKDALNGGRVESVGGQAVKAARRKTHDPAAADDLGRPAD
jgi:hypothetical protein